MLFRSNYGCHWLTNVSAMAEGFASAVLIRAAIPVAGLDAIRSARAKSKRDTELLSGPGRLSAGLGIDSRHYGIDLLDPRSELHLVPGRGPERLLVSTRIGLAPGKGEELPWRFLHPEWVAWSSTPRFRGGVEVAGVDGTCSGTRA